MTDDDTPEIESPHLVQESNPAAADLDSPGRMLRAAREQQGMSVAALSAGTALSSTIIERLEDDRFDALPQPVFVRGYYRKCAKVLGISEQELADVYARCAGVEGQRPPMVGPVDVMPRDVTPHRSRIWKWLSTIALLVVAIVVAWAWLPGALDELTGQKGPAAGTVIERDEGVVVTTSGNNQPSLPAQPTQAASPLADAGAVASATEHGPDLNETTTAAATALRESAQKQAAAEQVDPQGDVPVAVNEAGAADSNRQASGNQLVLDFKQRSWVSVHDADGSVLLKGLVEAGSQRVLTGELPYDVVLGYAPGVEVTLGGQPIDLTGRIESNNTAEFTLQGDHN